MGRVGEPEMVRLLLSNDLMPTQHSAERAPTVSLLAFADKLGFKDLAVSKLSAELFEAVSNLDSEYMRAILAHGLSVDFLVNAKERKSALYILVEAPFDLYDVRDAKEQFEAVECLLAMGADPNALDATRSPMLIHPLQRSGPWNEKLVDVLLSHGAKLTLRVGETKKNVFAYAKKHCVDQRILKIIRAYHHQTQKSQNHRNRNRGKCTENVEIEIEANSDPMLTAVMHSAKPNITKSYKRTRKPKTKKAATR